MEEISIGQIIFLIFFSGFISIDRLAGLNIMISRPIVVSGIIGMWFAIKEFKIKFYLPKLNSIIKQFKYSSEFFLSRVSVSAYTNTNTFCLGLIGSNIMVGYYVAAEKIYNAINGIQAPLGQALYPFVAKHKDMIL